MLRFSLRLPCHVAILSILLLSVLQKSIAQTTPTLTVDATGNPHAIIPTSMESPVTAWTQPLQRKFRLLISAGGAMLPPATTGK
jgi:hypothetical protein